jgi:hypothetical protein
MGYIAIIHVPDHTTATDIINSAAPINVLADQGRLVGMYEFPNHRENTCRGYCTVKNTGAWTRDRKGFMKCAICGSRNKKIRRWFTEALFDWFGANLMGSNAPALFRTPEGYGPRDGLAPLK